MPGLGRTVAGPDCLVCVESELGMETAEGNITYVIEATRIAYERSQVAVGESSGS